MIDWPLIGNSHITKYLEKSIINKKISNAYLFGGADDLGKTTLASFFAKLLLCSNSQNAPCGVCPSCKTFHNSGILHPDLHIVKREREKKNISIKQIIKLIEGLSLSPFIGKRKIGIIKHADTMSIKSFNAMLKTLEEARGGLILILVVNELSLIPDTVKSRCQILNFRSVAFEDIYKNLVEEKNVSRNSARDYAKVSLGRPALALKFLQDQDFFYKYMKRVDAFMNFFVEDLNTRFSAIDSLLGNSVGQIAVKDAYRILNVWSGVVRDLLLLTLNNSKSIQHQLVVDRVNAGKFVLPGSQTLISIYKSIKQAEDYLANNINPKAALHGVVMGTF